MELHKEKIELIRIARKINLQVDLLIKKKGPEPVRIAREVYWRILHQRGYSYSRVARIFGYSHATIMSGVRRVTELIESGDAYTIDILEKMINTKVSMMMSKTEHISMNGNVLHCDCCGKDYTLDLPMRLGVLAKRIEAFRMLHEDCNADDIKEMYDEKNK